MKKENFEPGNLKEALPAWEKWWKRENTEAVRYIIRQRGELSLLDPVLKDWMPKSVTAKWDTWKPELMGARALELSIAEDNFAYIDEWLDYMEVYAGLYRHERAGYNFICPGFGPVCLTALISGFFRYVEPTVWHEPEEAMSFEEITAIIENPTPEVIKYRDYADRMLRRTAERLSGKYIISMPDLGDGMDVLSSLRHNINLLTDTMDCPDAIKDTLDVVGRFGDSVYKSYAEILDEANNGLSACVMRYLSAEPTYLTYCDFSAMTGPDMFAEFVLPMVRRHCSKFPGRTVYHLDGPGQLPHVKYLCSIQDLFAVQWVPGAGNPKSNDESWHPLYRQLLDAGKRICIGTYDESLFKKFPEKEFAVSG